MHYSGIKLPEDKKKLLNCYLFITVRLKSLWIEYVNYVESPLGSQESFYYVIIFNEMDFFEGLRSRIEDKLPPKLMKTMRAIDDYSSW